jgi:hypothetical protein
MTVPKLKIASTVTAEHGTEFAADWIEVALNTLEAYEALTRRRLIEWPRARAAQLRYHGIEDEIFDLTFHSPEVTNAISIAFVKAATAVFKRERGR